jgi:hypothetical protein
MGLTKRDYDWLEGVPSKAKELTLKADSDEQLVDITGTIKGVEKALSGVRAGVAAELVSGTEGQRYRMTQGNRSQFSYNTPLLLKTISEALGLTLTMTLGYLLNRNIITIEWRFKALTSFLDEKDISISVARHDVTDGDPEHMGRWLKPDYPSYTPVEQ